MDDVKRLYRTGVDDVKRLYRTGVDDVLYRTYVMYNACVAAGVGEVKRLHCAWVHTV